MNNPYKIIYELREIIAELSERCREQEADIKELLKEREWISAKDRLPKYEQDVLVYLINGEETRIVPCNYANGVWYDCIMNCVAVPEHITHWMPLPEPPKEDVE